MPEHPPRSRCAFFRDPIRLCLALLAGLVAISGCASLSEFFGCNGDVDSQSPDPRPKPAATAEAEAASKPAAAGPSGDDAQMGRRLAALRPEVAAGETDPTPGSLKPTEMMEAYWQAVARTVEKQRTDKAAGEGQTAAAADPSTPAEPAAEPTPAAVPQPQAAPTPRPAPAAGVRAAGPLMPVITDVKAIEPEPEPAAPLPAPPPPIRPAAHVQPQPAEPAPAEDAPFELSSTIRRLTRQLDAAGGDDADGQRLLRLLHLANRDEVAALKDVEALPTEQRETFSQLMWLAANVWGINERLSPEGRAAESLVALEELERSLRRTAGLQLRTLKLCTEVVGYGVYEEMKEPVFQSGRAGRVIVYVEVENFLSKLGADGKYHTKLQLRLQLFRRGGSSVLWHKEYPNIEDASNNYRRDLYVPVLIEWPTLLSAGDYVLKVAVDDMHAGRTDERKAAIQFK